MENFFKKNTTTLSLEEFFAVSAKDKTTEEPTVEMDYVMINGVGWATRNLAAHGKFVENPQDFGALFQWGRRGDGHEQRTSERYPNDNNNDEHGFISGTENFDANGQIVSSHPAFGKFILSRCDWTNQLISLWNSGTKSSPIKTANDPSPPGWRMPTIADIFALVSASSRWIDNWNGTGVAGRVFGTAPNTLFLPAAGYRSNSNGAVNGEGTYGGYWSSSLGGTARARYLDFISFVNVNKDYRAYGRSVRCVLE